VDAAILCNNYKQSFNNEENMPNNGQNNINNLTINYNDGEILIIS